MKKIHILIFKVHVKWLCVWLCYMYVPGMYYVLRVTYVITFMYYTRGTHQYSLKIGGSEGTYMYVYMCT